MMEMASDFIHRARYILTQARRSLDDQEFAVCVMQCEEATELGIKSSILAVGKRYAREHGVFADLGRPDVRPLFPAWFQERVPRLDIISRVFAELRKYPKYGNEALNAPTSILFGTTRQKLILEMPKKS